MTRAGSSAPGRLTVILQVSRDVSARGVGQIWFQAGAKCGRSTAHHPQVPSRGRLVSLLDWVLFVPLSWLETGIRNQEVVVVNVTCYARSRLTTRGRPAIGQAHCAARSKSTGSFRPLIGERTDAALNAQFVDPAG